MEKADPIHRDLPRHDHIRQGPNLSRGEANIAVANAPVENGIEALDTMIRLIKENTEPSGLVEENPQLSEKDISLGQHLHAQV
jgi:hypothetical protein